MFQRGGTKPFLAKKAVGAMHPNEITVLLRQADEGDREAANRLFVLVEADLKAIARRRKRLGPAVADASTTSLVDKAFLQLVGREISPWDPGDRKKFFGFVSKKIQELLLKAVRSERAAKRGGERRRVPLDNDEVAAGPAGGSNPDLQIDLKEALDAFERFAPEDALLFRFRYYLACTFQEAAEVLGLSATEAKRRYERARLWLQDKLRGYDLDA
jgi:RNA polymerase sigma factor (TIGR02999 family)